MKRYFITGTGTGIGKTYITARLIKQAQRLGKSVAAFKPVISGFDAGQVSGSDAGLLIAAMDLWPQPDIIDRVSPWRYAAPLAPSMAARLEKKAIDFAGLVEHSRAVAQGQEEIVLIEGVGGVMVPLTDDKTVLDWIDAVEMPVLFIAGNYLGAISHTLTALDVLKARGVVPAAVIVNESEGDAVALDMTRAEIAHWAGASMPVLAHRRGGDGGELIALLG